MKYALYILAAATGLMLRAGISSLYGLAYTLNGLDIFNALIALVFCYIGRTLAWELAEIQAEEQAERCGNAAEPAKHGKNAA